MSKRKTRTRRHRRRAKAQLRNPKSVRPHREHAGREDGLFVLGIAHALQSKAMTWMRRHVEEHREPKTGEVNLTTLAEACAADFEMNHEGGPLDDETHWIWTAAIKVGGERR